MHIHTYTHMHKKTHTHLYMDKRCIYIHLTNEFYYFGEFEIRKSNILDKNNIEIGGQFGVQVF